MSFRQRIKNQECRTVTNHYLCEDCVIHVIKEWLKERGQESIAIQKELAFDPIIPMVNVNQLIAELEDCDIEKQKVKL